MKYKKSRNNDKRDRKRSEAKERQKNYDELTTKQKLAKLKKAPGDSTKQRIKLKRENNSNI